MLDELMKTGKDRKKLLRRRWPRNYKEKEKEKRWLTFLKGKSFNLNKDLTCSSSLVPPFCLHGSVPMVSAAVGRSTTSSTKDAGDA